MDIEACKEKCPEYSEEVYFFFKYAVKRRLILKTGVNVHKRKTCLRNSKQLHNCINFDMFEVKPFVRLVHIW